MSVWYHPLFNDAIVTMNPRYIIPLNEVVCWVLGVGCWVLGVDPISDEPFETSVYQAP